MVSVRVGVCVRVYVLEFGFRIRFSIRGYSLGSESWSGLWLCLVLDLEIGVGSGFMIRFRCYG